MWNIKHSTPSPYTETVTVKNPNPYQHHLNPHPPPSLFLPLLASYLLTLSLTLLYFIIFIYFLICLYVETLQKVQVEEVFEKKKWNITTTKLL